MIQLDLPAAFLASLFFLDLGRKSIKQKTQNTDGRYPAVYHRFLSRSLLFAGLVITPICIYFVVGWPGWEQLYWSRRFEETMHNGGINALLPGLCGLAIILVSYLGHFIGYRWITAGHLKYLRFAYIIISTAVIMVILLHHPAFLLVGTYDQYHNLNGQTRDSMASIFDNWEGFTVALGGVLIYFAIALAYMILKIQKDNRGESKKI